jgi:PAS domain S-box-containing protein
MHQMTRLRSLLSRLDLRGKIAVALLSAALVMGSIVTLAAYFVARYQLTEHAEALLESRALLERREIELRLAGIISLADSLAENAVTANALADSRGREVYLDPLLRNQNLGVSGADLSVVDYRGRPIASTFDNAPDYREHVGFQQMMLRGSAWAEVIEESQQNASLLMALPIRYRLTGNVEGGVIVRIPLTPLLGQGDWADSRWLAGRVGQLLVGQKPTREAFEMAAELVLPSPLDGLGLKLVLARDRAVAFQALDVLLFLFLGIGVLVVIGVMAFAHFGARFIAAPLGELAAAAEEIAASGRPVARLPVRGVDEFGRLSAAFNTMVERLRQSYGGLEDLVAERTRDYEESQQEADKASSLLREAVQSVAVGFTIYDENDHLVMCNEAYLRFYEDSRDLIVPGASFADIVRQSAERSPHRDVIGDIDHWVAQQLSQHREHHGLPVEQQLADGRWLLIIEHRTPSGYIVGNRIDITELKNTAEALRVREAYLRATLDNLPFFFWLKDTECRFLAVNKVFSEACGRANPNDLEGLSDFDVWPQDLAASYRADDLAVLAGRADKVVEEPVLRGSEKSWIETYKKAVITADGSLLGTVGFARDITTRKQMERALAESEQRWELAVRGANDGVWDWNLTTGEAYFSERWKTMLGYCGDEISGQGAAWRSLIHPDDVEPVNRAVRAHIGGETEFYEAEFRLRCKDGRYKWILSRGQALFDEAGKPVRMSGSHTDISERRIAEASLRDRTEQLNAIFALSPDGFVSFDTERRVKYASPAFRRMTGIDEAAVAGLDEDAFSERLARDCIDQARFPGLATLRAALRENGERVGSGRRQLIEMAGAGKRVLEVGVRLSQTETVSQILYFRDVTHETEVDRMKSEFLSTAAHELRTPMACILGFSEIMITEEFPEEERREFLSAIHRQSELMVSIINELLDLARIEARRGKDFNFERLDARDLLGEVVGSFKAPAGRPGPLAPAAEAPHWVRADRKKLTQAINNVLSNAYKYSPDGGTVVVQLINQPGSADVPARTGIRIVDQGIGMTPAQLARVCERFYRADTSGKIPGTGLGMSIVKEIVDLHGGDMALSSEPQAGTVVTLWIPAA